MSTIRKYDAESAKANLKKLKSQKSVDPNRFTPNKATTQQSHSYVFFILPPLELGEPCSDGKVAGAKTADMGMDGQFAIRGGNHWASQKPYACPRIQANEECELCNTGFELMKDIPKTEENKKARSAIAKSYLGQEYFIANVYFHPMFSKQNPPAVNGKVMYLDLPRAILNRCESVLEADPEMQGKAAGVFYDPMRAFPLEMKVTLVNGYNNYEQSAFLAAPSAIGANEEEIEKILASRHCLFDKLEKIDLAQIHKINNALLNAQHDDAGDDQAGGSVVSESVETAPAPVETAPAAKPTGLPAANKPAATTTPVSTTKAPTTAKTPAAAPAKAPPPVTKKPTPAPTPAPTPVATVEDTSGDDDPDMAALVDALNAESES